MAIADTLTEVGLPGSATTLSSPGKAVGASSINVGSTASWPANGKTVFFGIRTVNPSTISSGNPSGLVAGTYTVWKGIVATNSLTNLTLVYGSDQTYSAGTNTQVFIPIDALRHNALVAWGSQDHDLQGHHKTLTDVNGNAWISQSATASAVNGIQVANNITGKDPKLSATGSDTNVNLQLDGKGSGVAVARNPELVFDHVNSGGVWSGLGYGSTLTAAMTAAVCYINGRRIAIPAIATRTFTASKDTYVDVLDNLDGTGTVVYTEVTNNAASPALAANSLRIGIIVSAATIAAATSINQGQETATVPVISLTMFYSVTDSLGNLICPRDPNRKVIGYREVRSSISATGTAITFVTGLSLPVIIPTGRKIKVTVYAPDVANNPSAGYVTLSIWDGTVGSGTQIQNAQTYMSTGGASANQHLQVILTPGATSKTYNVGIQTTVATGRLDATATTPAYILVELV